MERSLPMRGKKKTELPSPSHHPRILSIRPRSARRHPAFLVGCIDLTNNFAITPLQSHPSEIRRSEVTHTESRLASHLVATCRAVTTARQFCKRLIGTTLIPRRDFLTLAGAAMASLAICRDGFAEAAKAPPKPENVLSPHAALQRLAKG